MSFRIEMRNVLITVKVEVKVRKEPLDVLTFLPGLPFTNRIDVCPPNGQHCPGNVR